MITLNTIMPFRGLSSSSQRRRNERQKEKADTYTRKSGKPFSSTTSRVAQLVTEVGRMDV